MGGGGDADVVGIIVGAGDLGVAGRNGVGSGRQKIEERLSGVVGVERGVVAIETDGLVEVGQVWKYSALIFGPPEDRWSDLLLTSHLA